jgi:hypothetical protein
LLRWLSGRRRSGLISGRLRWILSIAGVGVGGRRLGGHEGALYEGEDAEEDEVQGPSMAPSENILLVEQGNDAGK